MSQYRLFNGRASIDPSCSPHGSNSDQAILPRVNYVYSTDRPFCRDTYTYSGVVRPFTRLFTEWRKGLVFYFPNSGSGQLKYLRSRVRPRNWTRASSMDDIRDSAAFAVSGWEKLKELMLPPL